MEEKLDIPVETLVYGATCIHQSKRPLLQNYYNYTKQDEQKIVKEVFLSRNLKKKRHIILFMKIVMAHIFLPAMI